MKPGCQGAIVVAEARSPDDSSLTRRCVIMKLSDFTVAHFLETKRQNAAAVLILIPQNISTIPDDIIQVVTNYFTKELLAFCVTS